MYSLISGLQFSLMVVFGTDTIVETHALPTMRSTGEKNENATKVMMRLLLPCLKSVDGECCEYGNVN